MQILRTGKIFFVLFSIGFLTGIIYINWIPDKEIASMLLFDQKIIDRIIRLNLTDFDYFIYVLKIRVFPLIMLILFGYLKINKWIIGCCYLWTGLLCGVFITTSILQMGMKGIIQVFIILFPHFIFYAIVYIVITWHSFYYPVYKWNALKIMVIIMLFLLGVIFESYVNPIILSVLCNFLFC